MPPKPPTKQAKAKPPEQTPPPPPPISTEDILRVLRHMMGDKDAAMIYDLSIVTKTGELTRIAGHVTFSGMLTEKRMASAGNEVEDQLRLLVLKPVAAEVQAYTDSVLLAAAQAHDQDDDFTSPPIQALPDIHEAADIPGIPAMLPPPVELNEQS